MTQLPIKIAGLGSYLPERRVSSAELAERFHIPREQIERTTGVYERRYATHETTVSMGAAAARVALDRAGMEVSDIDAIIGASMAQQAIPCTAALLQRELGAPDGRSACFDINATCLSFLFAVQTAAQMIAAGVYRNVLIVSSEIASASLNPAQWESAVLFGDAAAAVVLTRSQPNEVSAIRYTRMQTYSSGADWTRLLGGGTLHHPNDPTTMPEMNLFEMNGPAVFRFALRVLRPFVDEMCTALGWERDAITKVVPHQASRHGLEIVSTRLEFRAEQVYANLAYRGNCVAASIPLALCEAVEERRIQRGDRVLLLGTGAGLTLGAVVFVF